MTTASNLKKVLIINEVLSGLPFKPNNQSYLNFSSELGQFFSEKIKAISMMRFKEKRVIALLDKFGKKISAVIFISQAMVPQAVHLSSRRKRFKFIVFCGAISEEIKVIRRTKNLFLLNKNLSREDSFKKALEIIES